MKLQEGVFSVSDAATPAKSHIHVVAGDEHAGRSRTNDDARPWWRPCRCSSQRRIAAMSFHLYPRCRWRRARRTQPHKRRRQTMVAPMSLLVAATNRCHEFSPISTLSLATSTPDAAAQTTTPDHGGAHVAARRSDESLP